MCISIFMKRIFSRMCCKRKPENWIDQLDVQIKKEAIDLSRKEPLLRLDTDEITIIV